MEWVALLKLEFHHLDKSLQWNVLRLMLGALQVHYALLGGDEVDKDGVSRKGISEDEWRAIRTRNLLSRDEIRRLQAFAGFKPFLPVSWAMAEVKNILLRESERARAVGTSSSSSSSSSSVSSMNALGDDVAVRAVIASFRDVAFKFRAHSSATFSLLNAPVPFAYFHVMKVNSSLLGSSHDRISYSRTPGDFLLSLLIISYARHTFAVTSPTLPTHHLVRSPHLCTPWQRAHSPAHSSPAMELAHPAHSALILYIGADAAGTLWSSSWTGRRSSPPSSLHSSALSWSASARLPCKTSLYARSTDYARYKASI